MPASGATPFAKDDVRATGWIRAEAKTTRTSQYRFDPRDFPPLRKRALTMGETPLFLIELSNGRTRIALTDRPIRPEGIRDVLDVVTKTFRFSEKVVTGWISRAHPHPYMTELRFGDLTLYATPYDDFLEAMRGRRTDP